jgi:ABC-type multidrug transport system fused ATPase/permease subunit
MSDKKDERKAPAASNSILASVKASLGLLTPEQRRRYWLLVAAQASLAFLDLGGVFLLGLVAYLATASLTNSELPPVLTQVLTFFDLEDLSRGATIALVAVVAAVLLMGRTILSLVIYRWICHFLAKCQAQISVDLMRKTLNSNLLFIQSESSSQLNYAIVSGPGFVVTINLASTASVVSEIVLFVVLIAGLIFINPWITLFMVLFFFVFAFSLHKATSNLSTRLGRDQNQFSIKSYRHLQETLHSSREITVGGRRRTYQDLLEGLVRPLSWTYSRIQIMAYLPKITYELALILGVIGLIGWEFWRNGANLAVANIAVFLAASARLLPALQRTNGVLTAMRTGSGQAEPTYSLAEELQDQPTLQPSQNTIDRITSAIAEGYSRLNATIVMERVSFTYPNSFNPAIESLSLVCPARTSTAVVGRTGAGKSTLVDLMLGILEPQSGEVALSGITPLQAAERWPGGIGYVPQSISLFDSSVRENIALGLPPDSYDDELVWQALGIAHLDEFIRSKPDGLETLIGERGVRLSGGQRQRLGLARALFTRPKLLVLDEATSSIDTETEHAITEALTSLAGETTIVTIAHRLSTVRKADQVVYLESGRVVSVGAFEEVRLEVPQFERQAQLAGL